MAIRILGIAINEYEDKILNNISNCLNDLNEIVSILNSKYLIDDVELLSNKEQTSRKYLYNKLYDYFLNCLENDSVLLLYNGHGQYNDSLQTTYWQTSDSDSTETSSWFNLNDLMNFIRISPAFHISIISNSCFSGAIFEDPTRGGGIDALLGKKSRLALTSGSIEKVSDGKPDSLSPFTETVLDVLKNNTQEELTFASFSHQVLLAFNPQRSQTPMFGSLTTVGHDGGSSIFELNLTEDEHPKFKDISLALNIDLPININYECKIPLFFENKFFDNLFVNTYIQKIAFDIISETRAYINEDKEHVIENSKEMGYDLSIHYTIETLNEELLSIVIHIHSYFGGPYPNYYNHTLNIAFKPDRKLTLNDLFKYSDLQEFLIEKINRYGEDNEQKEALHQYREYIKDNEVEFSISEGKITIYFINQMPKVIKALGYLYFPI